MAGGGINEGFELQDKEFEEYYAGFDKARLLEEYGRIRDANIESLNDVGLLRRIVYVGNRINSYGSGNTKSGVSYG